MRSVFFILLCSVCGLHSAAQPHFEIIDDAKIRVNTIGVKNRKADEPVIVFENGSGTPMGNWDKVIADSLNLGPMITYDRPGIGESEAIDEIPTLKTVADRLIKLLDQLDVEPPFVLVGHSLGGVYVRGFAVYYPEMLAGLVIVDPGDFTETQINKRAYYKVLGLSEKQIDEQIRMEIDTRAARRVNAPKSIFREGEMLDRLRVQDFNAIQSTPLPNIPVHILVGGRFDMPKKMRNSYSEALFRSKINHRVVRWTEVIQSVDRGMLFYSGDAGHFVQWEDPELVIASIKLVLKDYYEMQANHADQ